MDQICDGHRLACPPLNRITATEATRRRRWPLQCLVTTLQLLLLVTVTKATDGGGGASGLLNSLELNSAATDDVRKQWGLPDTTATVGKLFQYHIPTDAFSGSVHHYEVNQVSTNELPKWLHFDATSSILEGVPTEKDEGLVFLVVRAFGQRDADGKSQFVQDTFSLDVLPFSRDASRSLLLKDVGLPTSVTCSPNEEITSMSIILDADFHSLSPAERVQLMIRIVDSVNVSQDILRLLPYEFTDHVLDGNTIMAGPGNARQKHNVGILAQWQVGCGRQSSDAYETLVTNVERTSRDGSLAAALGGISVVGWHLSVVKSQLRPRRQSFLGSIPTPVPGIMPSHHHPSYTETVIHEAYPVEGEQPDNHVEEDEGPTPDVRIVPTMASPTFTMATATHRHRHHHELGTNPRGSHHSERDHQYLIPEEEPSLTASPTFHYFRGTPVLSTPYPTPVLPTVAATTTTSSHLESTDTMLRPSLVTHPHELAPIETAKTYGFTLSPTDDLIAPTGTSEVLTTTTSTVAAPGATHQNFRPVIRNRIPKLVFVAGKISQYQIPASTFFDFEQGETPELKLVLTNVDGTALHSSSWIQFNSAKQKIYAVPLEENTGKWDFVLEAIDNEGDSVKESVEINVRQHPSSRNVHHEFVMQLKHDSRRFNVNIDWQIVLAENLAKFFGDRDVQSILVRSVVPDSVFTWTNESLPNHPCPHDRIMELMREMASRDGSPSRYLRKILSPLFRPQKVTVNLLGHCKPKTPVTTASHVNMKPEVPNHIDEITATVGEFLSFRVPEDTFHDEEDGNSRRLQLTFLTIDGASVPRTSWIRFDPNLQEFIGLPLDEDVGQREYKLVAMDRNGSSAFDALQVTVFSRDSKKRPSIEFSIHIDVDYDKFNRNVYNRVMVLDKLSHLFGDPDPRYITVQSITRGSVVYAWSNNTLPYEPCPTDEIKKLVRFMFHENGTVLPRMLETFLPEFNVTAANVMPLGVCLADISPTHIGVMPTSTVETEHATSDEDIYITMVIPAVVMAALLLIAAIIACFLYRRKRKGKMTMEDSGTFVNKGIPIIFADELEDKPDPAKSPVIMKDEKPPLPPPEYPRSSGSASPTTPPTDRRRNEPHHRGHPHHHHQQQPQHHHHHSSRGGHDDDFGLEQVENSPPYQPPPPFTANRDSRLNRPKHTPTYRLPPPYVPP